MVGDNGYKMSGMIALPNIVLWESEILGILKKVEGMQSGGDDNHPMFRKIYCIIHSMIKKNYNNSFHGKL